jgi:hypothetical protein
VEGAGKKVHCGVTWMLDGGKSEKKQLGCERNVSDISLVVRGLAAMQEATKKT